MSQVDNGRTEEPINPSVIQDYYAQQGIMTDPGPYGYLFDALPSDPSELCAVIHGLMAINLWIDLGLLQVSEERRQEWQVRSVESKLRHILAMDLQPLGVVRPFEQRFLGTCRDVSLLLCAALRHHSIPARLRVGFDHWGPERHDHWICEYWSPEVQRWVRVDPYLHQVSYEQERLPPEMRAGVAAMDYDPLDADSEAFLTGGQAWQRCRAGEDDPNHFGIGTEWGLWFIRDNMLRDLLALNKIEVLPWDRWGMISGKRDNPMPAELAFLDRVAAITQAPDAAFAEVRVLYEQTTDLHLPSEYARDIQ